MLITPTTESRSYPVLIGEHGTGKTTLIRLAVDGLEEPKGVVYVDVPNTEPSQFIKAMQEALGWNPDPLIDSGKRN